MAFQIKDLMIRVLPSSSGAARPMDDAAVLCGQATAGEFCPTASAGAAWLCGQATAGEFCPTASAGAAWLCGQATAGEFCPTASAGAAWLCGEATAGDFCPTASAGAFQAVEHAGQAAPVEGLEMLRRQMRELMAREAARTTALA